eukprot:Phypoly_transcript_11567.p1 GENE.Phypoly_transcript_11567~~Phypoly_transcript_11567.p1  ORF type:complete len:334 (+),score=63.05 Phypoly_transcript_11567:119-1120(+)
MSFVCPLCPGSSEYDIIIDYARGECVCRRCGLIVEERRDKWYEEREDEDVSTTTSQAARFHQKIWARLENEESATLRSLKQSIENAMALLYNGDRPIILRKALEFCEEAFRIELAQKNGKIPMWDYKKIQNKSRPKRKSRTTKKEEDSDDTTSDEGSDVDTRKKAKRENERNDKKEGEKEGSKSIEEDGDLEIIAVIEAGSENTNKEENNKNDKAENGEKNHKLDREDTTVSKTKKRKGFDSEESADEYQEVEVTKKGKEKQSTHSRKEKRSKHSTKNMIVAYSLIKALEECKSTNEERRTISDINEKLKTHIQLASIESYEKKLEPYFKNCL